MKVRPFLVAIASGLAYGLTLRLSIHSQALPQSFVQSPGFFPAYMVMTLGFLAVGPFAVGWMTASTTKPDGEHHTAEWIFLPWLAMLLSDLCVFVVGAEGAICILFALPITFLFASLGGLAGGLVTRSRIRRRGVMTACIAILPLLIAGLESRRPAPVEIRTVETSTVIHAPATAVWANVASVPAITHNELTPTWTHRIGFPLPVAATLNHPGVGGVRRASFEHGLLFYETVTTWKPLDDLRFDIKADTSAIPPTTLDDHVTIGGGYFDVLDGEYQLEALANGDTLLHLRSRERLSTDFNWYAGLWSDAVMTDLQTSILSVVQHRAEREAQTPYEVPPARR